MSISPSSYTVNKDTALRLGAKGRRVFTPAGWNQCLREAGKYAGDWWIGHYGVLRFNRVYATNTLGYSPGGAKRGRMNRGEAPFYSSGQFMAGFNTKSRTESTATKGVARFVVMIPSGWLRPHPEHVATFRKVPPGEKQAVSREFRRALIQSLQAGRVAHAKKIQAKAQAKLEKKAANAAARAARRKKTSTKKAT